MPRPWSRSSSETWLLLTSRRRYTSQLHGMPCAFPELPAILQVGILNGVQLMYWGLALEVGTLVISHAWNGSVHAAVQLHLHVAIEHVTSAACTSVQAYARKAIYAHEVKPESKCVCCCKIHSWLLLLHLLSLCMCCHAWCTSFPAPACLMCHADHHINSNIILPHYTNTPAGFNLDATVANRGG